MRKLSILCLMIIFSAVGLLAAQRQVAPSNGLILKNQSVRLEFEQKGLGLSSQVDLEIQERESASHIFRLYKSDGRQCEPVASTEDAYVAQLRYFVHCVAHRQPPSFCPPQESYQVIQVMNAAPLSGGERAHYRAGREAGAMVSLRRMVRQVKT